MTIALRDKLIGMRRLGVGDRQSRDLFGYADQPPDPRWPGGARLALNFVVNYKEGGERSGLHGD